LQFSLFWQLNGYVSTIEPITSCTVQSIMGLSASYSAELYGLLNSTKNVVISDVAFWRRFKLFGHSVCSHIQWRRQAWVEGGAKLQNVA